MTTTQITPNQYGIYAGSVFLGASNKAAAIEKARSLVFGRRYAALDVVWAESHPTDSGDPTALLATGPNGEVYELLQGNEFAKVLSVGSSVGLRGEPTLPGVDWTQF